VVNDDVAAGSLASHDAMHGCHSRAVMQMSAPIEIAVMADTHDLGDHAIVVDSVNDTIVPLARRYDSWQASFSHPAGRESLASASMRLTMRLLSAFGLGTRVGTAL
jgi:hypothetical protein